MISKEELKEEVDKLPDNRLDEVITLGHHNVEFSPVIFWDIDHTKIDWQQRSRFVISRVVRYGTVDDWRKAKNFYGLDIIKRDMLEEPDLDNRTLSFLSCVLNILKENFKCYTSRLLRPAHSSF